MDTHEFSRFFRALIAAVLLGASLVHADEPPGPAPDAEAPLPSESAAKPVGGESAAEPQKDEVEQDEEKKSDYNIIPIPEIILDPNEGNTYGLMGVMLLTDEKDEIKYMIAPDVRWNETKGVFPSFRLFGYPTETRRYTIQVGKSTTRDEDYEAEFAERGLLDKKMFVLGKFLYERDSTERFFGFGNNTDQNRESNYTGEDLYADIQPGYWVLPSVNVSYRMRIRRHNVQPGQVTSVPFIADEHPEVRHR